MSTFVHPTAVVSQRAELGEGTHVGPFCTVGDEVRLGERVRLESHVVVDGRTEVGDDTHVFPFASLGLAPQDLKYRGEPAETRVGRRNRIREFVTVHRGTEGGGMLTSLGDDGVIMANAATLAGHVTVEDGANVGAYSGVHQFCRVGREAYVGGYSVVVKDALPFALSVGNHAKCYGLNVTGMKRRGYPRATIDALHHAFHLLLSAKLNTSQAVERIQTEITDSPEVSYVLSFIAESNRGVTK